jgi:hypothetical protein
VLGALPQVFGIWLEIPATGRVPGPAARWRGERRSGHACTAGSGGAGG